MRRRSQPVSLSLTDEVREITVSARTRERSAITSSIRPSAKYALSGSGLRLANGSTTIAFLRRDRGSLWRLRRLQRGQELQHRREPVRRNLG